MFTARRRCSPGECPAAEGLLDPCCCVEPVVDIDVDELSDDERAHFQAHGSPDQKELIAVWLDGDREAELIAGRRDVMPELASGGAQACGSCESGHRCVTHSPLQHEGW
jgi:hypothetical protein